MTKQEIHHYIEMTPFRGNEPIFRNTKIRVAHIIEDFAKGMDFEEVLKEHPQLSRSHLQAAFIYCQVAFQENDMARLLLLFK